MFVTTRNLLIFWNNFATALSNEDPLHLFGPQFLSPKFRWSPLGSLMCWLSFQGSTSWGRPFRRTGHPPTPTPLPADGECRPIGRRGGVWRAVVRRCGVLRRPPPTPGRRGRPARHPSIPAAHPHGLHTGSLPICMLNDCPNFALVVGFPSGVEEVSDCWAQAQ